MKRFISAALVCLLFGVGHGPAKASEPVPTFLEFSTDDCVRDPRAVFLIPDGVSPLGFVSHVTPLVTFGWSLWTREPLPPGAKTFEVPIQSRSSRDKISFVRTAFTYQTAANAPGPSVFSTPLEIPASLVMMDSQFCIDKRRQDAETARLAQLPNFQPVEMRYLGTSHLLLDFARSDNNPSSSMQYEITTDGVNWSPVRPFNRQPFRATIPSPIAVGFLVQSLGVNVVAIRLRGLNSAGYGSWLEIPTGRASGSPRVEVAAKYSSEGYLLTTNPILLPSPDSRLRPPPLGCATSTVELAELDSEGIVPGDRFKIETALEELPYKPNVAYSDGMKSLAVLLAGHNPERTSFNVLLCPGELEITPRYLRVKVTRLADNAHVEGKIEVLQQPWGAVERAKAATEALCAQSSISRFGTNITIEQPRVQKTSKAQGTLRGTLFRAGFVAPNQRFFAYLASSKPPKSLTTGTTDAYGQFEFSFSLPAGKTGTKHRIFIVVDDASGPSVPFMRVIESSETAIDLTWGKTGLTYAPSPADWIPVQSSTCANSFASLPSLFEDDRQSAAWFIAKRLYYGMKNKPSKSNASKPASGPTPLPSAGSSVTKPPSAGSGSSIGRQCWVSGYTTKTGKRVSGYFRRC